MSAAACQGAPEPPAPASAPGDDTASALGTLEQDLSVRQCRRELSGCLSNAGSVSGLAECTVDFEDCFTQAALDGLGQGGLIADCRASANDCLSGAVGRGDINACGDILTECADDVLDEVRGVFPLIRPTIGRILTIVGRTVRGVIEVVDGAPAIVLNGVRECRNQVGTCLDAALSDLDIGTCAAGLDECVNSVVDVIDPLVETVDPLIDQLPGPNITEILDGTDACRGDARDCLVGALNLDDVRACGDVLGTCVDDVTTIVGDTVDDVTDVVDNTVDTVNDVLDPLPIAIPKPENVIDCSLQLTQCLAGLNNPFDCARQAQSCAKQ